MKKKSRTQMDTGKADQSEKQKASFKIEAPTQSMVRYRLGEPGAIELVKLRKFLLRSILEIVELRAPKCVEEVLDQLIGRAFDGDETITINWPLIISVNLLLTKWDTKEIER